MAEAKHNDGMPQGVMHSVSRVTASTSFAPDADMVWETNVRPVGVNDPIQSVQLILTYNNLMYDIVGAALAKLGVEYSKLITGAYDSKAFDAEMTRVLETLNAGTAQK